MESDAEKRPELGDLEAALSGGSATLAPFLEETHAADLADWLVELEEEEQLQVLRHLGDEERSELFKFAGDELRADLLLLLDSAHVARAVEELPADEAVDLLALADETRTEAILRSVDFERAQGLRELATYDAETAGGLMTTEYVAVGPEAHVGDAIKEIKSEEGPAGEEELGVFVVDSAGQPIGYVSDRDLMRTPIHTPIQDVMETDLITVAVDADQEEVGQLVDKYSFLAVPVVDGSGALIGVISAEDAKDALREEVEEDILRLVGTSPTEQQTRLSVAKRVRHRLPLQALTVVGGLLTAWLLDQTLGSTGGDAADILRYLPIIIGLAGNVGIQSSTILVRAFATGEVSQDREGAVLATEVLVGLVIGLICGGTTMVVAGSMESQMFGAAVGGAIAVAVTWAAFLGCIVPMSCQRLGIDPAIVAGPFLIALSDVSGAAIFVGVAGMTLELGG